MQKKPARRPFYYAIPLPSKSISENVNEALNASIVEQLNSQKVMEKIFDIKQLLQKPIAMMTGEELAFLIGSSMEPKANEATPIVQNAPTTASRASPRCSDAACQPPTVSSAAASSMLPSRRSGERLSWMPTWHFN